jgi:hypothetical protein
VAVLRAFLAAVRHQDRTSLLHHLIAAVMLASMMQALEARHLLEWLDGAMLRVTAGESASDPRDNDPGQRYRPSIVDITPAAFSAVFQERNPLDRDRLVELLGAIAQRQARILAVDIDVSPAIYEGKAPRALDQLLQKLVQSGTQVVLVLPNPSEANGNLGWIRARCADGVHFASPAITERMGAVTRIDLNTPSLAAIALQLDGRRGGGQAETANAPGHAHAEPDLANQICEAVAHAQSERVLAAAARMPAPEPGESKAEARETVPLHPAAVAMRSLMPSAVDVALVDGHAGLAGSAALAPVVFVGGSYDVNDTFESAQGPVQGLYVHAASFTSLAMKTSELHRLAVFAFDVGLGVMLGILFGAMWTVYGAATRALQMTWHEAFSAGAGSHAAPDAAPAGHAPHRARKWRAIAALIGNRFWLAALWAIPCGLAGIAIYSSHWFLIRGLWVNPGPIILGMFLHAMSLRHIPAEHATASSKGAVITLLREHPGSIVAQLPVAVMFLAIGFWPHG